MSGRGAGGPGTRGGHSGWVTSAVRKRGGGPRPDPMLPKGGPSCDGDHGPAWSPGRGTGQREAWVPRAPAAPPGRVTSPHPPPGGAAPPASARRGWTVAAACFSQSVCISSSVWWEGLPEAAGGAVALGPAARCAGSPEWPATGAAPLGARVQAPGAGGSRGPCGPSAAGSEGLRWVLGPELLPPPACPLFGARCSTTPLLPSGGPACAPKMVTPLCSLQVTQTQGGSATVLGGAAPLSRQTRRTPVMYPNAGVGALPAQEGGGQPGQAVGPGSKGSGVMLPKWSLGFSAHFLGLWLLWGAGHKPTVGESWNEHP